MEPKTDRYWYPQLRRPVSELGIVPMLNRRVFHYAVPFDYSSIQWGWIHVGLDLSFYDESARQVNLRTGILAIICMLISLLASILYASRFVKPILQLQSVVERVASGNLMARADIRSKDEIEQLAHAFNGMADMILHRDKELSRGQARS
jgi:methyl-accepting chemotaxis protein